MKKNISHLITIGRELISITTELNYKSIATTVFDIYLNLRHSLFPLVLFSYVVAGCSLFTDNKEIVWHEEKLNKYVIYAYSPGTDSLAIINVEDGQILKMLYDIESIQNIVTNRDGSRLFVSTAKGQAGTNPGKVIMINTSTWEKETIYDRAVHLLSDRNGGVYFITKENDPETGFVVTNRRFGIINPSTGTLTEKDTIDVRWGAREDYSYVELDPNRPLLYAFDADDRLYSYNYVTGRIRYLFNEINFSMLVRMTLSHNGRSLFMLGGPVLDVVNESVKGTLPVWRLGTAAVRKDMAEVYITDPGGFLRPPLPSGKVFIYDPTNDQITGDILVDVDIPGDDFPIRTTDDIYLTEIERYAVVNDRMGTFFVLDLKYRNVTHASSYFDENNIITLSLERIYLAKKPADL